MCQKILRMDRAGLPTSGQDPLRGEFAPGTGEWQLSPSGPLAHPAAIGFKKASANHVLYTNPEITS